MIRGPLQNLKYTAILWIMLQTAGKGRYPAHFFSYLSQQKFNQTAGLTAWFSFT